MKPTAKPHPPAADLPGLCYSLMERAPVPMAEVEGAGHIMRYVNPAFCRLVGKDRKTLMGRPFAEIVQEGDRCLEVLDRVYRTAEPETHTESEQLEPHPPYWTYAIWPIVDANQRSVGMMMQVTETTLFHQQTARMNQELLLSSVRQHELTEAAEKLSDRLRAEIAERERAQEALREKEAWQRLLMEHVKDFAIFSLEKEGCVKDWNAGAEEAFGFTREEIRGQPGAIVFTPEDRAAGIPEKEMTTAEREEYALDERWHLRKNGERFFVSGTMRPLRDTAGKLLGFVKVARDITDRRQNEEALRQAHTDLQLHAEELTRFNSAAVGRELRMIELKKEINELCLRHGEAARYPLEFEKEGKDNDD